MPQWSDSESHELTLSQYCDGPGCRRVVRRATVAERRAHWQWGGGAHREFHLSGDGWGEDMRGKRGAVPLVLAVVSTGLAAAPASAVVSTIYVLNGPGSNCTDNGVGSSGAPCCATSKASAAVQPGQTVMIARGSSPDPATITAKGTAAAPIRFVGQS